jgi:LDH2 family malate/lactate/ureidoglycolate dehydrogenase
MTSGGENLLFDSDAMRAFASAMFQAVGAKEAAAWIVADHLIDASLRGVHSHGIIRVPQYLDEATRGAFDPAADPSIVSRHGGRVNIAGNRAFGQVGGCFAARIAAETAEQTGCCLASVGQIAHTGRAGAYAELIAQEGMFGAVFASGTGLEGRRVSPYGGIDGRYITDPIAYAYGAGSNLVSADFATSSTAEGVVRSLRNRGMRAPAWMLLDSEGHPSTDPWVLYESPPGTIQPLGGDGLGHKGSALNLLVEVLATLIGGHEFDEESSPHNTLAVLAVKTDPGFGTRAARLGAFVLASRPSNPDRPVMLPGTPERRSLAAARGVEVDAPTWASMHEWHDRLGVALPEPLD